MRIGKLLVAPLVVGLATLLACCIASGDEPEIKAAEPGTLLVIDGNGKEHKLKEWKFTQGIRHLAWLAPEGKGEKEPPEGKKEPPEGKQPRPGPRQKAPQGGPEAFEFRDEQSTNFVKGILTYIPLDRLRALDFDDMKQTVTVRVATGPKPDTDAVVTGTTRFTGINKISIEASVDKGELGVAEVKFLGGVPKGIRGVRFAAPKVEEAKPGRPAVVTVADKPGVKNVQPVTELQALYTLADGEKVSPLLFFKKTLKIDVAKIKRLAAAGEGDEASALTVTLKDGEEQTLTLLTEVMLDGKQARLEGLLGKVPAGYKLFPIARVGAVDFDMAEPPPPRRVDLQVRR
jgi:hypothetical protein